MKRDLSLYYVSKGKWRLLAAELDWATYLSIHRSKQPAIDLFDAVLDYIWERMGIRVVVQGVLDRRQIAGNRRLKFLVEKARTMSAAGKAAFLKDRGVWEVATLVPSVGGEIEEIRSDTREFLEYYIKKYGCPRRRKCRKSGGRGAAATR